MKHVLLMIAMMMGQSVLATDKKPLIANRIIEEAIRSRWSLNKPTGELTKADLEKVTTLRLRGTQITDAGLKELAKLTQLALLYLKHTKVTKAGVAQLQKALPKCEILSNAKK